MTDNDTDNDEAKRKDRFVEEEPEAGNLSDMLQELRVLLQGAQVLIGFLIILPFYQGFPALSSTQHAVYLATFGCTLTSLIIFSAPAAQHRLEWPLRDRAKFKEFSTHMIVFGTIPLSLALILVADLVVSQVLGDAYGLAAAALAAIAIAGLWWLFPYTKRLGNRRLANV
jgi:uncharacterized protein involved in cysteine biosynthesis